MTETQIANLIAVTALTVSVGSLIRVEFKSRSDARWSDTFAIHREFNSKEFGSNRFTAGRFVKANCGTDWENVADLSTLKGSDAEVQCIYEVMRFYHRLMILLENDRLVKAQIFPMFGPDFAWWWGFIFERMKHRPTWRTGPSIRALAAWMKLHATSEEWDRLVSQGHRDYHSEAVS